MDDVIPLTERGNIHIADTGIEQHFTCVYSGRGCSEGVPAIHIHGMDAVDNPGLVFVELDSVELFVDRLKAGKLQDIEHGSIATVPDDENRDCVACGDTVHGAAIELRRQVDGSGSMPRIARALLRDVESVRPTVWCHRECAGDLATVVDRVWDELDTLLVENL